MVIMVSILVIFMVIIMIIIVIIMVIMDIEATQRHVGGLNGCVVELARSTRGHLSHEVRMRTP